MHPLLRPTLASDKGSGAPLIIRVKDDPLTATQPAVRLDRVGQSEGRFSRKIARSLGVMMAHLYDHRILYPTGSSALLALDSGDQDVVPIGA